MKDPILITISMDEAKEEAFIMANIANTLTKLRCNPEEINCAKRVMHLFCDAVNEMVEREVLEVEENGQCL